MEYTYLANRYIYSDTVKALQAELCKYGYLDKNGIDGYYGLNTEKAFKKFQTKIGAVPNGIFDSESFNINEIAKAENDGKLFVSTSDASTSGTSVDEDERVNKPFFNNDKTYEFRKGNIDVVIEYSNSATQKRKIEDIRIRSMSQIIDASGEAIADVYNFIARDIIEYNN